MPLRGTWLAALDPMPSLQNWFQLEPEEVFMYGSPY